MARLAVFVLLTIAVSPSLAQEKKPADPFALPEGVKPIRLKVTTAAAPVPALRYRLLPELREQQTGNAVVLYYRSFSPEWQVHRDPKRSKILDKWSEDPRAVPPKELEWVRTSAALKQLDLGARRSHVDWEMLEPLRREGIYLLLGDVQGFRESARLLAARVRLETAERDFDKSIYSLQTGLKLARDVGDAPTLIQALVGMAIAGVMFEQIDELIATPGSPNLYWSLTDLPARFIDLGKPYQGEKIWVDNMFPGVRETLANPKAPPLSEAQVQSVIDKLLKNWSAFEHGSNEWKTRLGLGVLAASAQTEARRFLLAQGRSKEVVASMSPLQAFLLLELHNYDRMYDDMVKWTALPYPQARKGLKAAVKQLKDAKANGQVGTLIATLLLPATEKVQHASARTERRIAGLRVVEALRLFATNHDGKFPEALTDIKEVPIPLDPMTGDPFRYRLDNDRAMLFGPAPADEPAGAHNVLVYELTL